MGSIPLMMGSVAGPPFHWAMTIPKEKQVVIFESLSLDATIIWEDTDDIWWYLPSHRRPKGALITMLYTVYNTISWQVWTPIPVAADHTINERTGEHHFVTHSEHLWTIVAYTNKQIRMKMMKVKSTNESHMITMINMTTCSFRILQMLCAHRVSKYPAQKTTFPNHFRGFGGVLFFLKFRIGTFCQRSQRHLPPNGLL